jgi:catechol 2,3-dioxygenase-like lactoylglutathione lyase family enzyme
MLDSNQAFHGFAVPDIDQAAAFYGDTLGLETSREHGMLTLKIGGGTPTFVYPKPDHEPATYTILNFPVGDVEQAVDELSARGVEFLRYDGLDQDAKGIHRGQGPDIAWFTDPAGNVLSVLKPD